MNLKNNSISSYHLAVDDKFTLPRFIYVVVDTFQSVNKLLRDLALYQTVIRIRKRLKQLT